MMVPALISIPHCSGHVPVEIRRQMLLSEEMLLDPAQHFLWEGDPHTDLIYGLCDVTHVLSATVSRFVVDLNRERDADGENGVIKCTDFQRQPLYPPGFALDEAESEARLRRYWDPYHVEYERLLALDNVHFFVEGHTMSPCGPAMGPDAGRPRPVICLGNNGGEDGGGQLVSCPPEALRALQAAAQTIFADLITETFTRPDDRMDVTLNDPFTGGGNLARYGHPHHPAAKPGFLVEFNRRLYLHDETSTRPIPGRIEALRSGTNQLLRVAADLLHPRVHP